MNLDTILEMSKTVEIDAAELGDGYTSYGIAKILNETLAKVGITTAVPPQMIYNYAKNGRVNGVKGAKRFTEDEVMQFVAKEVAKRAPSIRNTVAAEAPAKPAAEPKKNTTK